jgi:hypothetical protein
MIAIKMLSNSDDVKGEQKVFEFTTILMDNIDAIQGAIEGKDASSLQQERLLLSLA